MRPYETKPDTCPHCSTKLNRATDPRDRRSPEKGDISICYKCGGVNQFGDDLTLEKAPDGFLEDLKRDDPTAYQSVMHYITLIKSGMLRVEGDQLKLGEKEE